MSRRQAVALVLGAVAAVLAGAVKYVLHYDGANLAVFAAAVVGLLTFGALRACGGGDRAPGALPPAGAVVCGMVGNHGDRVHGAADGVAFRALGLDTVEMTAIWAVAGLRCVSES